MGLFNNYEKPGKGVRKDEKRKKGPALYFELLFRKFGSYFKLNLTYMVTCTPAFLVLFFISGYVLQELIQKEQALAILPIIISFFLTSLFSLSPFSSGYYYILRNFSEERHAWLFSDFAEQFAKNRSKSLITFFIDLFAVSAFLIFSRVYIMSAFFISKIFFVPYAVLVLALITYKNMMTYKWTMIVTLDLNLRTIYKNAFLLVMCEFPTTLKYMFWEIIYFGIFGFLFYQIEMLGFLLYILIGLSGLGLIQQLCFFTQFRKYFLGGKTINEVLNEMQENEKTEE